ncbi:hypothetical protein GTQ43_20860 [Nostoc sp. KVJ3]|uniref:hypothetical protein n=1 Tax=Nostoc sp. KVJ3 TaxID=457945 RepID=UPI002237D8A6|nr:hypothetical protein [Nostoc sp. KVJ3]MCW5316176.1 hypothetical protein [Nostoc sp. KVJ3]
MKTSQQYSKVKRVYYDIESGLRSEVRQSKEQTCFDSTAEFNCYKMISNYFDKALFDIDVHSTLDFGSIRWKVDFQITARRNQPIANAVLAELVNTFHDTTHTSLAQVFIEYKGVQDNNFISKMSQLSSITPMFAKTIILVSDHNTAFGCYDNNRKRFYMHPIVSSNLLESTLRQIVQG